MVTNLFNFTIEIAKIIVLMFGLFNYKIKHTKLGNYEMPFSVYSIILFVICIVGFVLYGNRHGSVAFFWVRQSVYCIAIPVVALSLEGKYRFSLSTICFLGICIFDEGVILLLTKSMLIEYTDLYEGFGAVLINSVTGVISLVVAYFLQKYYFSKRPFSPNSFQLASWVYMIIYIFCQIGLLVLLIAANEGNLFMFYDGFRNFGDYLLLFCGASYTAIGLFMIYNNTRKREFKELAIINNKLVESQALYFQTLLEKEMDTRRFRHDISNHIFCMDTLLKNKNYDGLSDYLSQIDQTMINLKPKYQTGNFLINAIINSITERYSNVTLNWSGNIPDNLLLSKVDTCTIFSNVLENAFHAASACTSDRCVDVTVKSAAHGLYFNIKNTRSEPINENRGKLLTIKTDKIHHGYGLSNAIACTNRNEGSLQYSYTKNTFTVEIVLPNTF